MAAFGEIVGDIIKAGAKEAPGVLSNVSKYVPKSQSFISQILGTADEAISPGVRKAVADALTRNSSSTETRLANSYLESGASKEALERMRALKRRLPKTETGERLSLGSRKSNFENAAAISQILKPWQAERARLMYNYQGLDERARSIVLSELSKTENRLDAARLAEELKHTSNLLPPKFDYDSNQIPQTDALLALGGGFPEFQGTIFSDQLATEFGNNSPAVGMFDAFISDGMSPSDAREAVRALLG